MEVMRKEKTSQVFLTKGPEYIIYDVL